MERIHTGAAAAADRQLEVRQTVRRMAEAALRRLNLADDFEVVTYVEDGGFVLKLSEGETDGIFVRFDKPFMAEWLYTKQSGEYESLTSTADALAMLVGDAAYTAARKAAENAK